MAEGEPAFGTLLASYRRAAGLTQEALAERAGLSVRGISDLERGQRQAPQAHTVRALAAALRLEAPERAAFAAAARPAIDELAKAWAPGVLEAVSKYMK